jgi:hypothetical protein
VRASTLTYVFVDSAWDCCLIFGICLSHSGANFVDVGKARH